VPAALEYDVEANVMGGGSIAQAGAVKLGIARALLETDEQLRVSLREQNLLTVDSRVKERKKYGQKAARRKFQFVKR
jgi:small subunit ribosomal protein S9